MKLLRLRGRKICDRVLKHGQLLKGKTMHIRYLCGAPRHPHADQQTSAVYIGAITSTHLDKSAVRRNRMRRRCREAWRIVLKETPPFAPVQLLILPRSSSLVSPFPEIRRDVLRFLPSLRACPKPPSAAAASSSSR